ncbi:cytochrome P450 [Streptomyces sp. NPDC090052]|uniref:cytochrome P450 n=1 Tax=unclassified Streptomyces TaxID=2593676 RepID=UPI00381F10CF|nr:cytochrome P450 [Streptomyces sp. NBC_01020]WSX44515.1 cytochrome P450 [Streptomyces sp. NBC_00963]WSX67477.1 cytochrome P450 [Streptomyces sp. NBC_00932]
MAGATIWSLLEPSALLNPHPIYREWYERSPVLWDPDIEAWLITGYDEAFTVLRDADRFCQDWRRVGVDTPPSLLSLQTLDPPEHTRIRHLMLEGFRTAGLDGVEQRTRARLDELLAEAEGAAGFDFVTRIAEPLTLYAVTGLLGVPDIDPAWFVPRSHTIVDSMDSSLRPECYEPGVAARAELSALVGAWIDAPLPEGFTAHVVRRAKEVGVERDILHNSLRVVLQAGFQTASRFLTTGLHALLRLPPEQRGPVDNDLAVNELVRYAGPVHVESRACVEDTVLGGRQIRRGQIVSMFLGAANRDPRTFDDSATVRWDRTPNRHLAFGRGPHACLGAQVATVIARTVFGTIGHRYPGARLLAEPRPRPNVTEHGMFELHVAL